MAFVYSGVATDPDDGVGLDEIVRAVNCHDELLAACRMAMESYARWCVLGPADEAACKAVQTAIRNAE